MAKKKTTAAKRDRPTSDSPASNRPRRGAAEALPEIPVWLAPVLYAVLAIFLFRDFVFSDQMLFGGDTLSLGYQARALYADALRELGRVPGWAPHILGGTPFLEALSAGDSLYPPSVFLLMLMEPYRALGWKLVLHVFLAGCFFYGWTRALGTTRAASLLAGTAYMLAPFLIGFVHPGHDGKIFVIALAPLLFWATERHFARPGLMTVSAIGMIVALVMYTTHFQMAYFLFGSVGLYAIYRTVQIARGADEVLGRDAAAEGRPRGAAEAARGTVDGASAMDGAAMAGAAAGGASAREAGVRWGRVGGLRFALFMLGSVLGAAGAAYQFVPAIDYVNEYSRRIQTTRESAGESGRAWSASYSLHPEEVMSFIVPEFPGNYAAGNEWTTGTYWGRNGFKDNHEYAGIIVLLLASLSFLGAARKQLRLFMVGWGIFALLYSLGANTPVWSIMYEVMPGISLFRANGMVSYLFGFAAITLAAFGLDNVLRLVATGDDDRLATVQRVAWIGAGVVGLLALLITSGVFTSIWTTVVYSGIDQRRLQVLAAHLPNIARGAAIVAFLTAAAAGTIWALVNGRIPAKAAVAILIGLVVVDEARVDAPFIQTLDFNVWSQPDPTVRTMLAAEQGGEPYRLWSLKDGSQDVRPAAHGAELVAGHHPNDLSRYRELIGMVGSGDARNLGNTNVRRILNVRYILWPSERGPAPQGSVVAQAQFTDGRVASTLLADGGLPRARLVGDAVVKSDAEAVPYIMSEAHDPEREVVLAEAPPVALDGSPPTGSVRWVTREADRFELAVESDRPALLVIADNWYPAWRATVDGEEAEVLRAYHTLRAVAVPAGTSTIEMWYESDLLDRSFLVSLLVLLTLPTLFAVGYWRRRTAAGLADGEGEPGEAS